MTTLDGKTLEVIWKEVAIELPTGETAKIALNDQSTVSDLKLICELEFGIPSNLQAFNMGESELQDWCTTSQAFEQQRSKQCVKPIKLEVPVWWGKLVCAALNREVENVSRRVKLPMQQITKEERWFTALFIGCCLGDENIISRVLLLDMKIASNTSTEAGRTLLHAAAAGGNIRCADSLIKSWKDFSPELFNARDLDNETPYDIAKRLGHQTMEKLLLCRSTTNNKDEKGENSGESGIDLNDHSPTEARVFSSDEEGTLAISRSSPDGSHNSSNYGEKSTAEARRLVECDENWRNAGGNVLLQRLENANVTPEKDVFGDAIAKQDRVSSPQSSESSSEEVLSAGETKILQPEYTCSVGQPLLQRRLGRPHSSRLPNFVFTEDEEQGKEDDLTHLPPLQETDLVSRPSSARVYWPPRWKRMATRSRSNPQTAPDTRSAPTSPQARRAGFSPNPTKKTTFPISAPNSPEFQARNRRCSEPFGPASIFGKNLTSGDMGFRRNSHQISAFSVPQPQFRRKSRSICEVTLNDALCDHWFKENEERLERPWNAWIAAKRKDSLQTSALPPTPERLSPGPTGSNSRRMSFDQWLSEKDLGKLRQMYALLSLESGKEDKQNKQCKGKSFEEWMEDKLQEMEKDKEREKEGQKEQRHEELQRDRRRRVSQQRYERWLKQKDQKALYEEEKQLKEAKIQMKLMRKRWEEEDEKRKKRPAQRTRSCPMNNSPNISRWRFSSLQTAHHAHNENAA